MLLDYISRQLTRGCAAPLPRPETKMIAELIEQRFGLPSANGHDTPADDELASILSHRTHRHYTDTLDFEDLIQQALVRGSQAFEVTPANLPSVA
jgi:hypothetical protein